MLEKIHGRTDRSAGVMGQSSSVSFHVPEYVCSYYVILSHERF